MKNRIDFKRHLFLIALMICSLVPAARGNLQSTGREINNFDADWFFFKGDPANAEKPEFNDAGWRKLNVPHDWSIEGPFDKDNPTGPGGGFLPAGVGWYRKHFDADGAGGDIFSQRYFIEFDGVMANSDVWINGAHLGKRPYGYISFAYELTGHLKKKGNVIAVRADNSAQPASRWYTGAGIYRHVRLVRTEKVFTENYGTFVTTPQVSRDRATVRVENLVVNRSDKPQHIALRVNLLAPNGKIVASGFTPIQTVAPGASFNFQKELAVKNPELWNVSDGILYEARVEVLRDGGKPVDRVSVPFGIREFRFDAGTGFWLNGKNFKIKGVCLHHDGSAFGAAVPLAVWEHRLKKLRELGVNAIRTAHNPPAPEFLGLTDRMGFLVMDETFDQWTVAKNPYDYHLAFNEWSKIDARDMVLRDRNHPSVIIYSAGNEIRDTPKAELAKTILTGLVEIFHKYDPTRPVTQALFRPNVSHDYDNGLADILDVVGQNYREKEILAAHKQKPTRKILGTENTHDINQWVAMRDNPEYSGQFIWVGIDYLGESRSFPNYAFGKGLLDRTATPRPVGFQRQSWWSEVPMVHITRRVAPDERTANDPGYEADEARRTQVLFSDWNPKSLAAHEENVEVYSNCAEVELLLNGRSLGKKAVPKDASPLNWTVNFAAGTIKAVGYNGGKAVSDFELRTAGKPAKILLTKNKRWITNSWDDVVFVTATIVDEDGVVVPGADMRVTFTVGDSGDLVAVDSGDNTDLDPFQAYDRKAFQGRVFAMIKANRSDGSIRITAQAENLKSNMVTIHILNKRRDH